MRLAWPFLPLACGIYFTCHVASAQEGAKANADSTMSLRERIQARRQAQQEARAHPQTQTGSGPRIEQPGDSTFTLEHGGLPRKYHVYVPRSYSAANPVPLLIAFHGGLGNMDHMASDDNYGLISKSVSAGFVVVFPNGFSKLPSG